jgi:hypothetical protein
MRKEWNILQKDLTTKSTRSKQFFAEESDHMIPFNQPKIIIDSVKEMIDCCKKLRLK